MTQHPETPERNEAHREAQDEGRKARAAQAGQTRTQRSTYDPASDPTIDWNHSNEISSQE